VHIGKSKDTTAVGVIAVEASSPSQGLTPKITEDARKRNKEYFDFNVWVLEVLLYVHKHEICLALVIRLNDFLLAQLLSRR